MRCERLLVLPSLCCLVLSGIGNKEHANCLGNSVQLMIVSLVGGGARLMACFPVSGSREPGEPPVVSGPGGSR